MSYFDNFDFSLDGDLKYITEEQVNSSYYGEYSSYYNSDNRELLGEIALWRAVLLQAFIDLKSKSKKKTKSYRKQKIGFQIIIKTMLLMCVIWRIAVIIW